MIINSLLDTDLYKLSMLQAVYHQCPSVITEFKFKCRNKPGIADDIHFFLRVQQEITALESLRFTAEELDYLRTLRFLKPDFIEYLEDYRLNPRKYVTVENRGGDLDIRIRGPWVKTILFEIPILSIVNECYYDRPIFRDRALDARERLEKKIALVKALDPLDQDSHSPFKFADFGTRRRYSRDHQLWVLNELRRQVPDHFFGTSNVLMAKILGITPIGTMAHEWVQAFQALTRVRNSQKLAFQTWASEYRGDLGIALSDTLGMNAFFSDFDPYFAKLFDGIRQDSGDPIEFGERAIAHYESMKIDPLTKTIVFSDGLDIPRALELYHHFRSRIRVSFGIGTNLTNDVGLEPLNIVIKMYKCQGQDVCKISDSPGKSMCESESYIEYVRSQFGIPKPYSEPVFGPTVLDKHGQATSVKTEGSCWYRMHWALISKFGAGTTITHKEFEDTAIFTPGLAFSTGTTHRDVLDRMREFGYIVVIGDEITITCPEKGAAGEQAH